MFRKNIIFSIVLIFLIESCAGTWDSVKRGITGEKRKSTDEFLVKKKDPLILPPDFENLPTPDERNEAQEEDTSFQKILIKNTSKEDIDLSKTSTETSILEQIRKK